MNDNLRRKREFARRLKELMIERGWSQSELSRQAGIPRDAVSTYVLGKSLPNQLNLTALARSLNTEEQILVPPVLGSGELADDTFAMFETAPGKLRLQVNKVVKTDTALRIAQLLRESGELVADGGSIFD